MGLFYLATLYASIRALDAAARSRTLWMTVAILACTLGMGTKEVMVTAPLMVMLWDRQFAPDRAISRKPLYVALLATWVDPGLTRGGWTPRVFGRPRLLGLAVVALPDDPGRCLGPLPAACASTHARSFSITNGRRRPRWRRCSGRVFWSVALLLATRRGYRQEITGRVRRRLVLPHPRPNLQRPSDHHRGRGRASHVPPFGRYHRSRGPWSLFATGRRVIEGRALKGRNALRLTGLITAAGRGAAPCPHDPGAERRLPGLRPHLGGHHREASQERAGPEQLRHLASGERAIRRGRAPSSRGRGAKAVVRRGSGQSRRRPLGPGPVR